MLPYMLLCGVDSVSGISESYWLLHIQISSTLACLLVWHMPLRGRTDGCMGDFGMWTLCTDFCCPGPNPQPWMVPSRAAVQELSWGSARGAIRCADLGADNCWFCTSDVVSERWVCRAGKMLLPLYRMVATPPTTRFSECGWGQCHLRFLFLVL
jgi:hypothetical protein